MTEPPLHEPADTPEAVPSAPAGVEAAANDIPAAAAKAETADLSGRLPIADAPVSAILIVSGTAADPWPVFEAWREILGTRPNGYELIIVGDGVRGEFGERLQAFAVAGAPLRFQATAGGLGAALRAGLSMAGQPLWLYAPCDRSYPPAGISRLWENIDHVDLVAGYRTVGGRRLRQRGRARAAWWLARALFAVRLSDMGCPVALARREVFRRIPIQSESWAAHTEVIAKANFLGFLMTEAAVPYEPAEAAESFGGYWRDVKRLFKHPDFGPPFLPPAAEAWRGTEDEPVPGGVPPTPRRD